MFNLQSALKSANCTPGSYQIYIPVVYTNGRSIKNTFAVVVNRLVGMALKIQHATSGSQHQSPNMGMANIHIDLIYNGVRRNSCTDLLYSAEKPSRILLANTWRIP